MTATRHLDIFDSRTETPSRSRNRIFTCGNTQIATSPFVYRGVGIFMPEKVGNLQMQCAWFKRHQKTIAAHIVKNRAIAATTANTKKQPKADASISCA